MSSADKCPHTETLSSWHDGHSSAEEEKSVEDHLAQCSHCAQKIESYRRMDDAIRQTLPNSEELTERILQACRTAETENGAYLSGFRRLKPTTAVFKWAALAAVIFSAGALIMMKVAPAPEKNLFSVAGSDKGDSIGGRGNRRDVVSESRSRANRTVAASANEARTPDSQFLSRVSSQPVVPLPYMETPSARLLDRTSSPPTEQNTGDVQTVKHVWILKDYALRQFSRNLENLLPPDATIISHSHDASTEKWTILVSDRQLRQLVSKFDKHGLSLVSPGYPRPRQKDAPPPTGKKVRYKVSVAGP